MYISAKDISNAVVEFLPKNYNKSISNIVAEFARNEIEVKEFTEKNVIKFFEHGNYYVYSKKEIRDGVIVEYKITSIIEFCYTEYYIPDNADKDMIKLFELYLSKITLDILDYKNAGKQILKYHSWHGISYELTRKNILKEQKVKSFGEEKIRNITLFGELCVSDNIYLIKLMQRLFKFTKEDYFGIRKLSNQIRIVQMFDAGDYDPDYTDIEFINYFIEELNLIKKDLFMSNKWNTIINIILTYFDFDNLVNIIDKFKITPEELFKNRQHFHTLVYREDNEFMIKVMKKLYDFDEQ